MPRVSGVLLLLSLVDVCRAEMCCMAMTASCLACTQGVTVDEYCASNPNTVGCPVEESSCPDTAPMPNSRCAGDFGGDCNYNEYCCGDTCTYTTFATCEGGTWLVAMVDLMPCLTYDEPVENPVAPPSPLCEPYESGACTNADVYASCVALEAAGCTELLVAESCPVQLSCAREPEEPEQSMCATYESGDCTNADVLATCQELEANGCTFIISTRMCPPQLSCGAYANAATVDSLPVASVDSPPEVDHSCTTDDDCAVKNVGNCCGYYPECTNVDYTPNLEAMAAWCEQSGMMSICGYEDITSCVCTAGRCSHLSGGDVDETASSDVDETGSPSAGDDVDETAEAVLVTIEAAGTPEDYDEAARADIIEAIATAAGVAATNVEITIVAASVHILATITVPADSSSTAVSSAVSTTLSSADAASAALGIDVIGAPTVEETTLTAAQGMVVLAQDQTPSQLRNSGSDDKNSRMVLTAVLAALGGLVVLAAVVGAMCYFKRGKSQMLPPETTTKVVSPGDTSHIP